MTGKKLQIKSINKNIPKYGNKIFCSYFLARVLPMPEKLPHIMRNEIKEESWQ